MTKSNAAFTNIEVTWIKMTSQLQLKAFTMDPISITVVVNCNNKFLLLEVLDLQRGRIIKTWPLESSSESNYEVFIRDALDNELLHQTTICC